MEEVFYTTRVKKWSGSWVVVLPPGVVRIFGFVHRDIVGVRKVGPCLVIKRLTPGAVMPLSAEELEAASVGERG